MTEVEEPRPEKDSEEVKAARTAVYLLKHIDETGRSVEARIDVDAGSRLALDDDRLPHYPVSNYVHGQLMVAFGCLGTLRRMMVTETENHIEVVTGPFGPYSIMRNAIDCAAIGRWLLQPQSRTLRVRRRLMVEMDEIKNSTSCRKEIGSGWTVWSKERKDRMQEVADAAGVGDINVRKLELPSMTSILRDSSMGNLGSGISRLAAWQLCSGHAHGKMWAKLATNELAQVEGTATDIGAQFRMTLNYASFLVLLDVAVDLVKDAAELYMQSTSAHTPLGRQSLFHLSWPADQRLSNTCLK